MIEQTKKELEQENWELISILKKSMRLNRDVISHNERWSIIWFIVALINLFAGILIGSTL